MRNRMGRFMLDRDFLLDFPESVADIINGMRFVPVRAELLFHVNKIEYIGMSPMFKLVEDGDGYKNYELDIREEKVGDDQFRHFLNGVHVKED